MNTTNVSPISIGKSARKALVLCLLAAAVAAFFVHETAQAREGAGHQYVDLVMTYEYGNKQVEYSVQNNGTATATGVAVSFLLEGLDITQTSEAPDVPDKRTVNGTKERFTWEVGTISAGETASNFSFSTSLHPGLKDDFDVGSSGLIGVITAAASSDQSEPAVLLANNVTTLYEYSYNKRSTLHMDGSMLALLLSVGDLRPDAGGDVKFGLTADNLNEAQPSGGSYVNLIGDIEIKVELSDGLQFKTGWTGEGIETSGRSATWRPKPVDSKIDNLFLSFPRSREIEIQTQLTSDTLDKIPLEERCITARVTDSKPPPSPDYALGSLKQCLGDDPPLLFTEGSIGILTPFPCIGDVNHICRDQDSDNTSDSKVVVAAVVPQYDEDVNLGVSRAEIQSNLRSQGVGRTDKDFRGISNANYFLPEDVVIQVKDPEGRVNDTYSHSLSSSGPTWQTGRKTTGRTGQDILANLSVSGVLVTYTKKTFNEQLSDWTSMDRRLSVTYKNGDPVSGGIQYRSNGTGKTFLTTNPQNTKTISIASTSTSVIPYFFEFPGLGTYSVGWIADVTHTDTNVYSDTGTYTFHVGPVSDLEVRDGGAGSLPPGQRAFSIVAVNHGPDTAPAARVTVTGLPVNAAVNYTASRGSFEFDSVAGAWVWDIGELLSKDTNQARTGRDGETLTIATGAANQVTAAIENTQDYSVCIDSSAEDVDAADETACTATTGNSWHSTVYYDYDDGNDEAVIRQVTGSGEARLSATQVRRDQRVVSVSWPVISTLNRRQVTHYEVARSNDGGLNWTLLSDRWPISTYFDPGASAGPSVRYRVRTVNDQGHKGRWSAGVGSGQSAKTPAQPQNVTAATSATSGASAITLSWEPPASDGGSPITGYRAQASATGTGGWSNACSTSGAAKLTCDHSGLSIGTTRHYRVAARNANGMGPWSDPPAVASTALGVPDAPRSLRAQAVQAASENAVRLTWTAPAKDNGSQVQGYEVEGSLDGSDWTWLGNTNGKLATELLDDGSGLWFEPGQTRHYRVRASNSVGDGQWSSTARATMAAEPPEGMSAWAQPNGQNAIDILWGEPHVKGAATITSYELQVCAPPKECAASNDSDYSRVASPSGTTLTYTHTGLQPGDERYYRVRARNSAGWSEWSWPDSATTLDLGLDSGAGLPGAPRLTARANGSSEIKLSWTEADDRGSEIDTYEIEFSGDGLYWDRLAYNWPDQTEFIHDGLDGGTRNYYRVRALILHEGRHIGGQWSTVVNATTVAGAPAEPLSLEGEGVAQASDDSKHDHVELTLKIRADSTITRYQVERSFDGGNSGWKQVSASKSAATTEDCTIDGTETKCETITLKDSTRDLFPGTYYYYRVAAVNSKGMGPYAYGYGQTAGDWVRAPSRPRLLTLSNVVRTAATVTWIEPEDSGGVAVTGYEYQWLRICGAGETENCGDWPQDADGFDIVTKTTSKSVRLSGLNAGGGYHFRVRAVNLAEEITGKGDWSYDVYIEVPDS